LESPLVDDRLLEPLPILPGQPALFAEKETRLLEVALLAAVPICVALATLIAVFTLAWI
jgi:hypothetical protein